MYVGKNIALAVWRKRDTGESLHTATVDISFAVVYKTVRGQRLPHLHHGTTGGTLYDTKKFVNTLLEWGLLCT